jgi:hypothetical protein
VPRKRCYSASMIDPVDVIFLRIAGIRIRREHSQLYHFNSRGPLLYQSKSQLTKFCNKRKFFIVRQNRTIYKITSVFITREIFFCRDNELTMVDFFNCRNIVLTIKKNSLIRNSGLSTRVRFPLNVSFV